MTMSRFNPIALLLLRSTVNSSPPDGAGPLQEFGTPDNFRLRWIVHPLRS